MRRTVHVNVVANVKSLCATRCVDWHTSGHHVVPIHAWMNVRPLHVALWVLVTFASPLICLRVLSARSSVSTVLKLKMLLLSGLLLVIWFIDRVAALCLVATPVMMLPSLLVIIKRGFLARILHPAFHVIFLLATFFRGSTGSLTSILSELAVDFRLLQDWVLL